MFQVYCIYIFFAQSAFLLLFNCHKNVGHSQPIANRSRSYRHPHPLGFSLRHQERKLLSQLVRGASCLFNNVAQHFQGGRTPPAPNVRSSAAHQRRQTELEFEAGREHETAVVGDPEGGP